MSFRFDVSYPLHTNNNFNQLESDILSQFQRDTNNSSIIQEKRTKYHNVIYLSDNPQDIAHVASALKRADPRMFIGFIDHNGKIIYYHPNELRYINSNLKEKYFHLLTSLTSPERVLHDYIVNLYTKFSQ